jgi:hypothetical protein
MTFANRGQLWAITCFFNPLGYARRRDNYTVFRRHLDIPLVAVELGYEGHFWLDSSDAEVMVRVEGGDILDQKERLLNIAMTRLPKDCTAVAWLDCDVVFGRNDWHEAVIDILRTHIMAQPFDRVLYLKKDAMPVQKDVMQIELSRRGMASSVTDTCTFEMAYDDACFTRQPNSASPGHAWVAHRDVMNKHGFYDRCIVGGADSAMNCAAYGAFHSVIRYHKMNCFQRNHYLEWAHPFYSTVSGRVSHVAGDLWHLWHGTISDRRTADNFDEILPYEYDPVQDLSLSAEGCWRWSTDKPELHRRVYNYFAGRNEDGSLSQQIG